MKELSDIAAQITKGKQLEENLPKYATGMLNIYEGFAYIKFAMNYYTFYDTLAEDRLSKPHFAQLSGLVGELNDIVGKVLSDEGNDIVQIERLTAIRDSAIDFMETVTAYVDRVTVLEYILNRVEFRFREEPFDNTYYYNSFTNELMHYILSDKDNMAIHARISNVVEQLPMRLSKNKFFAYLKDAFRLYYGTQRKTVDDFAYTIRTTGLLASVKDDACVFAQIEELWGRMKQADYKNITFEEYRQFSAEVMLASEQLTETANVYVQFMELVNDLLTILKAMPYELGKVQETDSARRAMGFVLSAFCGEDTEQGELLEKLTDIFIGFEGKQEKIGELVEKSDYAVDYVWNADILEDEALKNQYATLRDILKLQSGSEFVRLEEQDSLDIAPDTYVDEVCSSITEEFGASFASMNRMMVRAVMSAVLGILPGLFNNVDELQQFINAALSACTDSSEQQACVELLEAIMQE